MRRFEVSTGHSSGGWEGLHVRIVVDLFVSRAKPELAGLLDDATNDLAFGVFDRKVSAERILATIATVRPNVVMVSPSWLVLSPLLSRCLVVAGYSDALRVLGTSTATDALKIQAARRGFVDIVDTGRPTREVADRILGLQRGETPLRDDRLWQTIGESTPNHDMSNVTTDETDREIVELLSVGLSDRDIALGVHLSLQAVRNRVSSMLERSGCVNRTQLGWVFSSLSLVDLLMADIEPVDDPNGDLTPPRHRGGTLQ